MKVLGFPQTLPERVDYLMRAVMTRPTPNELLSETDITAWQDLIGNRLSSWARNPEQLSDDGVEAPSVEMIQLAMNVARVLRDQNVEAPDRMVPNGDGGIVFRWRSGDFTWSLELDADGSLETSLMEHDDLLTRHSLHTEPSR